MESNVSECRYGAFPASLDKTIYWCISMIYYFAFIRSFKCSFLLLFEFLFENSVTLGINVNIGPEDKLFIYTRKLLWLQVLLSFLTRAKALVL